MNPYEELEVPRDASPDMIKKAYRKKASKHHPDKDGGDTAKFQLVSRAYDILMDPAARKRYDETGQSEPAARSTILQTLAGIVMQLLDSAPNAEYFDLHKVVRDALLEAARGDAARIKSVKLKIAQLEKAQYRFVKKGKGENLMAEIVASTIRHKRADIEAFEQHMAMGKEMLALWDEYEYSNDQAPDERFSIFATISAAPRR